MSTQLSRAPVPTSTTDNALSTTHEHSTELAISQSVATARAEVEAAIIVAQRFARNEEVCFGKLMKSCQRPGFAEDVCYEYPRGGQKVRGLSIYFAREAARIWGNIQYGFHVINDTDEERTIRCFAWDMETNTKISFDDTFSKLVQRKGAWVKPDERDLRELMNNRGARVVRNCLLGLLPEDLKRDCLEQSDKTLSDRMAKDPDGEKKKIILAFQSLSINAAELERYLGHKLALATPDEVASLRRMYKSLADGQSTWAEYVADAIPPAKPGDASAGDFTSPKQAPAEGELIDDPTGKTAAKRKAKPAPEPEAAPTDECPDQPPEDWRSANG